jgi:hypothetical protein
MCGPWQAASDIVLQPEIGEFAYDDFVRAPELIRAGEMATRAVMAKVREWMPATQPQLSAAPIGSPVTAPALTTEPAPAKS